VSAGLPYVDTLDSIMGGKNVQLNNYIYTSPDFGAGYAYTMSYMYITPPSGERVLNTDVMAYQLWGRNGANDFWTIHRVKFPTNPNYFEASAPGYYGVQKAMFDILFSSTILTYRALRDSYEASYKCLGVGATEVGLLQSLTINGKACFIESISRDVVKNTLTIKASEVPT
jgi:hypothetical protein